MAKKEKSLMRQLIEERGTVTGKHIDVPEGKTLAEIDPETVRFYEALGDTKLTGELHTAIGDMYISYLDIPESIITRSDFKPLETAYRNYEANATVKNAAAFLDEAGKVYARAENSGYKVGNPYDTINAAIEADFAARQGVAGDIGRSATDIGATATDIGGSVTDIGATAKAYVDTTNGVGDNGIASGNIAKHLDINELVVADDSFLDSSGKVDWDKYAPNGGFKTGTRVDGQIIQKGETIDRYGNEFGRYTSPEGTSYDQRSLPYVENPNAYHKYIVIKDIENVSMGEVAPVFNHNGGGIQYLLPNSKNTLLTMDI